MILFRDCTAKFNVTARMDFLLLFCSEFEGVAPAVCALCMRCMHVSTLPYPWGVHCAL